MIPKDEGHKGYEDFFLLDLKLCVPRVHVCK